MKRITKNNKRILLVITIVITLVIVIMLHEDYCKKQNIKKNNNKISVILEQDDGNVEVSSFPPNDGTYVFDKIMCNNLSSSTSVTPTWDSTNWRLNITASSSSNIDGQFNCDIYFKPSFANILKTNNPPTTYATIPGRAASTTDEGLISGPNDDYGAKTYYFRGTAPDNYVTFANKTWRVVRINGDGSVRLILNTTTGTNSAWNTNYSNKTWSTALSYATYGNSTIKTAVETWYNSNIGNNTNYSSKVVTSKFCNDRTYTTSTDYYYFGAYNRLCTIASAIPSYICPNSSHIYSLKVGLLTADEVTFAGGLYLTNNTSYYLYKNIDWWALSPRDWNASSGPVRAWYINGDGNLRSSYLNNTRTLIPVISLNKNIIIATASPTNPGTSGNPYIVQ